jgi:hypothetical protein
VTAGEAHARRAILSRDRARKVREQSCPPEPDQRVVVEPVVASPGQPEDDR